MIGKRAKDGTKTIGLLRYLFGPGKDHAHENPHVIGGFMPAQILEPPLGPDGKPDLWALARVLDAPLALADTSRLKNDHLVYHCSFRAARDDRVLSDDEWMVIAREAMHRIGLARRDHEDQEVPWVAVRHADDHIHIAAVRVRPHGKIVHTWQDRNTLVDVAEWAEKKYNLTKVSRPGKNHGGPKKVQRAESEKAAREKRPVPARTVLRQQVEATAAAAFNEVTFFAGLESRGLQVRFRRSPDLSRRVIGYSVRLGGDLGSGQIWYGGGTLASGLSLPRLRRRWEGGPLTGRYMKVPVAKAVLKREVTAAAAASTTEAAFVSQLRARGLNVTFRTAPDRPGFRIGYSVTLPGLIRRDGQPLSFAGGTLSPGLTLGTLRARWRTGLPGAAPPGLFDGADAIQVWDHAAGVARVAAAELEARRIGPGVALAAADVLTVAADTTGSTQLRKAAESFGLAAQLPARKPTPPPDALSQALRTCARLMASSRAPARYQSPVSTGTAVLLLLVALVVIAMTLVIIRMLGRRDYQARHAVNAGLRLTTAADTWTPASPDQASFPGRPRLADKQTTARRPARRRGPARGTQPGPRRP